MSNSTILILVLIYCVGWCVTFTAACADWQWFGDHDVPEVFDQHRARRWTAFSALVAAIPPLWLATAFDTDFYRHGFQWGVRPRVIRED